MFIVSQISSRFLPPKHELLTVSEVKKAVANIHEVRKMRVGCWCREVAHFHESWVFRRFCSVLKAAVILALYHNMLFQCLKHLETNDSSYLAG